MMVADHRSGHMNFIGERELERSIQKGKILE